MYDLLALDMDGTLLNPDKQITSAVHDALAEWRRQKGRLTIASGRFPASVWLHARATQMNFPLIALNGSVIVDEVTGDLLKGKPLESEHTYELIRLVERFGAYIHLYGYNVLYVNEVNEMNAKWPLANVVVSPDKPLTEENYRDQLGYIQVKPTRDLKEFVQARTELVYKATVISEDPDVLDRMIYELEAWNAFAITRTGRRRFDVNDYGVSKRSALEQLCKEHGIASDKVAAVGDYDNDIEMLKWAGLSIAMGNAKENVKQISAVVTSSNQENGVAQAVLNYLITPNS